MKILVTGSAGFIGFHLTKALLERGDYVIGLDNINDYYDVELKYARLAELGIEKESIAENTLIESGSYSNHQFIKMDLGDLQALSSLLAEQQFDAICHLAAQAGVRSSQLDPHDYIHSNISGFMNVLEGCRLYGIKNLVYASSSSVYGLNKHQPYTAELKTDSPISLYAATKKSNELMAHVYAHQYGIKTTGLRFFTVYGPWGRPDMAPMLFADAITKNNPINLYNYGEMYRDFTYIDDTINGIMLSFDNLPASEILSSLYKIYNIGSGISTSIIDFISELERTMGKEVPKNLLPMQSGDVRSTHSDITESFNAIGYEPKVSLSDGIERFVEWHNHWYVHNQSSGRNDEILKMMIPNNQSEEEVI